MEPDIDGWNKEFYPIPASDRRATKSDIAAVKHSLRKWEGLLKKNLRKYGLIYNDGCIEYPAQIGADSCALCRRYPSDKLSAEDYRDDVDCCPRSACPLWQTLGEGCDEHEDSPWRFYQTTDDARPMVVALRRTLKRLQEKETNK